MPPPFNRKKASRNTRLMFYAYEKKIQCLKVEIYLLKIVRDNKKKKHEKTRRLKTLEFITGRITKENEKDVSI